MFTQTMNFQLNIEPDGFEQWSENMKKKIKEWYDENIWHIQNALDVFAQEYGANPTLGGAATAAQIISLFISINSEKRLFGDKNFDE